MHREDLQSSGWLESKANECEFARAILTSQRRRSLGQQLGGGSGDTIMKDWHIIAQSALSALLLAPYFYDAKREAGQLDRRK